MIAYFDILCKFSSNNSQSRDFHFLQVENVVNFGDLMAMELPSDRVMTLTSLIR